MDSLQAISNTWRKSLIELAAEWKEKSESDEHLKVTLDGEEGSDVEEPVCLPVLEDGYVYCQATECTFSHRECVREHSLNACSRCPASDQNATTGWALGFPSYCFLQEVHSFSRALSLSPIEHANDQLLSAYRIN